ncbi:unnamed protein product [Brassicogethes aeneus]|uniref:Uncharacterized protein n=1 Tax=Brassicogethes aeneus TaxID=1431903 RepID=A0A9P0B547_BRAAE|nr:unnamed protein product [Brassicogethes aeneus]
MNEKLSTSLDAAKLSERKSALVLTAVVQAIGQDPEKFNISYSAIRRNRNKNRKRIAIGLKNKFKPNVLLTVHWDGKMLEDITGKTVVDRLPIIVSGEGVAQLLGVPKLPNGTGKSIATAVYDATLAWEINNKVKCLGFDTTSCNTGMNIGACTLIEQKMKKDLLWLACRHHILEIMLEAVVIKCIGRSSGPDILLFKRFKKSWHIICKDDFQTLSSLPAGSTATLSEDNDFLVSFCRKQLEVFQPRDDYKELLELSIIFLGDIPLKGISFKAPAGLHRARWMAKCIYSLKIFMFRSQMDVSKWKHDNDIAERAVALMDEYNKLHTTDEEQKQFLLLTIQNFRQRKGSSNFNKSTLGQL